MQNKTSRQIKAKQGQDEYRRQHAEQMETYRAKQRQLKKDVEKNQDQKTINTLTDAVRARKARKRYYHQPLKVPIRQQTNYQEQIKLHMIHKWRYQEVIYQKKVKKCNNNQKVSEEDRLNHSKLFLCFDIIKMFLMQVSS